MNTLLTLSGWDVAVVFLLGSLAGACLMEAARIGAELMRRRRRAAARREAWRL
jgi:predicted N-acetyltransferase YhbS